MIDEVVIHDPRLDRWLRFANPVHVVKATRCNDVLPALRQAEDHVLRDGLFAAGFIAYEASSAFDKALHTQHASGFPLLWFGLYETVEELPSLPPAARDIELPESWNPSISREDYERAVETIRRYIKAGDTYQVNFTHRLTAPFTCSPWDFFMGIADTRGSPFAAYVETEDYALCSASPELFFTLEGQALRSRPMKGTARRGLTWQEDQAIAQTLQRSAKNRAENVMIVDMVRNDFGRVAETGSVTVTDMYSLEKYPTLWQMTSTVVAETSRSITDILCAAFPCASVTGAPKPRTMEIITEVEPQPRHIYTGSIGYFTPERHAQFNVAIRTAILDKQTGLAEYGVGGGIVWDSEANSEFEECRTKARILTRQLPHVSLLESILWTPAEGYFLLDYHFARMRDSAKYFSFELDESEAREGLLEFSRGLPSHPHKIRMLLSENGDLAYEAVAIVPPPVDGPLRVCLSPTPVDATDVLLYHKTTERRVYETARQATAAFDDVILWNGDGEITEASSSNIVATIAGNCYTPPVRCGLLAGTYRAWLIEQDLLSERVITVEDLRTCDALCLINSVRRERRATFCERDTA